MSSLTKKDYVTYDVYVQYGYESRMTANITHHNPHEQYTMGTVRTMLNVGKLAGLPLYIRFVLFTIYFTYCINITIFNRPIYLLFIAYELS